MINEKEKPKIVFCSSKNFKGCIRDRCYACSKMIYVKPVNKDIPGKLCESCGDIYFKKLKKIKDIDLQVQ